MILLPKSFGAVNFTGLDNIYPETMDISSPRAQLKIEMVAGGRLFDFNYGQRATLTPIPFSVRLLIATNDQVSLNDAYISLADPLWGIVGQFDIFYATAIDNIQWQINAACESVDKVISDNDRVSDPNSTIIPDIVLSFVPVTNWVRS